MSEEIKQIQEKITPILKEYGVLRASIFGSYARGEAKEQSDVDILIQAPKSMSFFTMFDLHSDLEQNLNKKVDLGTFASVKPQLKNIILNQQIPIL